MAVQDLINGVVESVIVDVWTEPRGVSGVVDVNALSRVRVEIKRHVVNRGAARHVLTQANDVRVVPGGAASFGKSSAKNRKVVEVASAWIPVRLTVRKVRVPAIDPYNRISSVRLVGRIISDRVPVQI